MVPQRRAQSVGLSATETSNNLQQQCNQREAGQVYALITGRRPVSRRNRASWYLNQLNKIVKCDDISVLEELSEESERAHLESRSSSGGVSSTNTNNNDNDKSPDDQYQDHHYIEPEGADIHCVSITSPQNIQHEPTTPSNTNGNAASSQLTIGDQQQYLFTPNSRVLFLSRSIATSIILDLSPSVVSVSSQNDCVFLDSMFDALKRVLHLLVKSHEVPSSPGQHSKPFVLESKIFVSVIAYTPFVVAKNNQVIVQNRRISYANIDQILVEIWICLNKLTQEIHELVSNTCGLNLDFDLTKTEGNVFVFPQSSSGGIIRHPGAVLEDIYELGLFSSNLMPRLSRLSLITITDGLFASTNDLNIFRLKSIAVSFVSLGAEAAYPDACFGYTPYIDLMKFIAKTTQGIYLSHKDLIKSSHSLSKRIQIPLLSNPMYRLFCWTLHSDMCEETTCDTPRATNFQKFNPAIDPMELSPEHVARFFCVDRPLGSLQPPAGYGRGTNNISNVDSHNYHDWRTVRKLDCNLDADFEQVLACLLREGYLIKSIQFKHKETSQIVARLVLHWRHNLDIEQELSAPYWSNTDPLVMGANSQLILRPPTNPLYGDTYCEVIVHGSYSFLHNLYCDRKSKRRSDYRDLSYRQYKQLIDGVVETHKRLQYLSRYYRDSSLSNVPSFLLHGNSLLYEQPHTNRLTSTIENVMVETKSSEFQEYWQEISCLDIKSWLNLMHMHTLRLVLEHDQPKHKNIHCQNANGRYTNVQCRRALSAISSFIKDYASFALLEDTTYIKFIYNKDDDLREIETSATKGFIIIRINKLLPIIVIYLMFTSGILDSHRTQIVSFLEDQLTKLRNVRSTSTNQMENILKSKTISPSSESCCVLIKSPLENMLKVYGRKFVNEYLIHNWSYGLPGSYPFSSQQQSSVKSSSTNTGNCSIDRYNLVFGKYLYGVRVVQTISNLPPDVVSPLTANILSKISAILVNFRIKQAFHIAFNNSGILNLVVELSMRDRSHGDHSSSCLCQYIVFPPTVTNCPAQSINSVLSSQTQLGSSNPNSASGSLANSDNYMKSVQDQSQQSRRDSGEIKIIKEYWIEQQYGMSAPSKAYHSSLQNMRYSEVVDHLHLTDLSISECLLTYELLQLLCDKLSPFYDLDSTFSRNESKTIPIMSPTTSTSSKNSAHLNLGPKSSPLLPSSLIEGTAKDPTPKVPLLELEYKFSVAKFLEHCQLASLNVLLFKDRSEFYEPTLEDLLIEQKLEQPGIRRGGPSLAKDFSNPIIGKHHQRKMSMDVNELEGDHVKREHRCSYQPDNANPFGYFNPIYSQSLNHSFLETLHKRLKQMHDKELILSDYDRKNLPTYLKRRMAHINVDKSCDTDDTVFNNYNSGRISSLSNEMMSDDLDLNCCDDYGEDLSIEWRCFIRKGNQENLMIVLIPTTLDDVSKWLDFVNSNNTPYNSGISSTTKYDPVCPIFVFRCSSTMINDHIMSFLKSGSELSLNKTCPESDLTLHFGQPCNYIGRLITSNDELNNEILPLNRYGALNSATSDEKTLEVVHFRAFLRKVKNTVLKSRFGSLNDAYLSELFIHKDDILYYINNVDMDTQKKYHVSTQLRSLSDFIKSYEEYNDSLPKEPGKPCNQLLNSILLQKCGLFINQPIARFNEANPLIKQMHDKKLLHLMKCNYKVELPILEENLAGSVLLKSFLRPSGVIGNQPSSVSTSNLALSSSINEKAVVQASLSNQAASSLGKGEGGRLMEMKCGSVGATGTSSSALFSERVKYQHQQQAPRFGSTSTLNNWSGSITESLVLEAFKGTKLGHIKEISNHYLYENDISLRHEAHMAEVLRMTSERKESHHYRKVLKSKGNYNQSHSAIDQALKRVDSLGRLEHFCLTPLLFSPSWRSKLAPVRDHTLDSTRLPDSWDNNNHHDAVSETSSESENQRIQQTRQEADDRWHQMVCNNYIKEYEQYIQTLGFNSVQIRYPSNASKASGGVPNATHTQPVSSVTKTSSSKRSSSNRATSEAYQHQVNAPEASYSNQQVFKLASPSGAQLSKGSISASNASLQGQSGLSSASSNTGYLIKFLNSGCLVFKVGFCKPYVYSILYSIEGERFNNSNVKLNMTAFLDELDNIKVTMHLHSFTYDYHLRSMYSYISGRQLTFSPGYHLISFLDDFRKYYQKAPNYARNHIICGDISIKNLKVTGQQLYNYIVTHNSAYNMEVLEMSSAFSSIVSSLSTRTFVQQEDLKSQQETSSLKDGIHNSLDSNPARSHANDYVLIELKREKVRYRDGKDSDIFECGLLITHDVQMSNLSNNCLSLKYFLLLTNQRDLYPKLIHTYDNFISLGCHRPIRLGVTQMKLRQPTTTNQAATTIPEAPQHKSSGATGLSSNLSDQEDFQSSDLLSSGELSGPQSIISIANSVQSSNSGLQFGVSGLDKAPSTTASSSVERPTFMTADNNPTAPEIQVNESGEIINRSLDGSLGLALVAVPSAASELASTATTNTLSTAIAVENQQVGSGSPNSKRKKSDSTCNNNNNSSSGNNKKNSIINQQDRTICDEEITYLGYFSSDEMDMLRFLQEKTTNLKGHIEQVVRLAETHYRRDYLWQKLMQRTAINYKLDDAPLTGDELIQLLAIVEAIDLAKLDPQLIPFTTLNINWYTKLLKAFSDLRQSSINQHRIYISTVKASKNLLLFIDPNCTTAFILLSVDSERSSVEITMLLKDKQECIRTNEKQSPNKTTAASVTNLSEQSAIAAFAFELDQDCQQLATDFINFCAAFMWSSLLT